MMPVLDELELQRAFNSFCKNYYEMKLSMQSLHYRGERIPY